ncbi:MAG: hypothetical protein RL189_1025 [Pseudomonadota bacterium]|jgi:hypothetical protein
MTVHCFSRPMSLRAPSLSSIAFLALFCSAFVLQSCESKRAAPPPSPELRPSGTTTTTQESSAKPAQSGPEIPYVTQFESALAKRDCDTIRKLEGQLIAPAESYAHSVTLATTWCAQQKSPQDKDALNRFTAAADRTLKQESPLFSAGFVEQLRAESYAAAGDLTSARNAFSKSVSVSALQFMSMVSGQTLRLDLQSIEPMLTGPQAALLKDVRSSLADPATQSAALTKLDELLSLVAQGTAYDKLLMARLKLFAAFELSFASQLATLEETRMKGDAAALEDVSGKIRRLFPSRAHQVRIDSITGANSAAKPTQTDTQNAAQANQCANLTPAAILSSTDRSDLSTDKALQLAKLALNDGKPGDAVEILDSLAEANKNERTRGLRREASEAHVKDMRRKASELYKRVSMTGDAQVKLDSLSQCKQILENILNKYPETDAYTRRNIQKFLNSVSENISEIKKGQLK